MVNIFRKYFALLPVLYLFVAIFLARSKVQYVYLAAAILVALTFAINYKRKLKPEIFLAYWMAALAVLGLSAAVILSIEKPYCQLQPQPDRCMFASYSQPAI